MIVKEFRIPLPMTLEEGNIGQLYAVLETAKHETGGGDGIEDLVNESFTDCNIGLFGIQSGQYTKKKMHIDHKVPAFVRLLTPKGSLYLQEESWYAYPYCKTLMTNEFLGDRLVITIETVHLPDGGSTENALNLPPEKLNMREVVFIDIAKNEGEVEEAGITSGTVEGFVSTKTGRGPLEPGWFNNVGKTIKQTPLMTCYKLVTVDVRIFGIQSRLEGYIINTQKRIFTAHHRRIFLLMDQWHELTMKDIRDLEDKTTLELKELRKTAYIRGSRD